MMFPIHVRLVFACLLIRSSIVNASTLTDVNNLYTRMLQIHNKHIRPGDDQKLPTVVNVTFNLVAIQEFDEVDGKFSVIGFFEVSWFDTRMTWNPLEYNNTYTVSFSQDDVWKPTLLIINPFSKIDEIGKDFMTVRYFYNGHAYWSPGEILISSCSVDVTYFPFDEQTCVITLMSWGTWPTEILLFSPLSTFKLGYYSEHGTWNITSTSSSDTVFSGLSLINLTTTMKRRPAFYVVNIVLPVLFLMALNSCVFILPSESGERVSYAITVLLAIAVFMTLTGDNLPKTSKPMSLLSYFLMFDLIFSSVICLGTMLGLRLHFKNPSHPVPCNLKRLVVCFKFVLSKETKNKIQKFIDDGKRSNPTLNQIDDTFSDSTISWTDVCKTLDILFFLISIFGLVVSIVLFYIILIKHN